MCSLPVGLPQVCERSVISILLRINRPGLDLHYDHSHGFSTLESMYTLFSRAEHLYLQVSVPVINEQCFELGVKPLQDAWSGCDIDVCLYRDPVTAM
jgi:hypothetical protein